MRKINEILVEEQMIRRIVSFFKMKGKIVDDNYYAIISNKSEIYNYCKGSSVVFEKAMKRLINRKELTEVRNLEGKTNPQTYELVLNIGEYIKDYAVICDDGIILSIPTLPLFLYPKEYYPFINLIREKSQSKKIKI